MTIRRWLAACAAALVPAVPAAAQQSPEAVAQAYFAHYRAGEMDRVAALMHPRALESFRGFLLEMGGEMLDDTPLAGRDLSTIPVDSIFLAFTEGEEAGDDEGFAEVFGTLDVQTLGHVLQGDSLAHVVYVGRLEFMGQPVQQTTLITLRRHDRGWLVDPGDGFLAIMGGGMMTLFMNAGMQAGMAGFAEALAEAEAHGHDEDDADRDDDDADDDDDEDGDPPSS